MQRSHAFNYVGECGKRSLAGVLLCDGFIYFLILVIIDSLHMIITLLSISQLIVEDNVSYFTLFTLPLSAILVSRFMLHLQSANCRVTDVASSQLTIPDGASLVFERVIGSLGTSISQDNYLLYD
ncbi:hypothetical protein LXA43DRAFT_378599 [Ganoderma leucocontextum]|nr:hypothetical protein LXA43DRAFT_378599 [Ganoderma leucocontextum]